MSPLTEWLSCCGRNDSDLLKVAAASVHLNIGHCFMDFPKIYCKDISYRSGFVEVSSGIHDGHVNLEIWNTHPDRVAIIREDSLNDEDVVAVTEIELNVPQAKELIRQLQLAISNLEAKNVG